MFTIYIYLIGLLIRNLVKNIQGIHLDATALCNETAA
jgi:hypothetical protein